MGEVDRHMEVIGRGLVDLVEERELRGRVERSLAEGRPLRVKFGMDPSSADLHLGHAVQLRKLRAIQDLGHQIVLIVGDATAMVGDPSGRNKLRPQLSRADVDANLVTYEEQAGLVLDLERTEVVRNSTWFDRMGFEDVLRLCGSMTVAQMLERDTFQKRMAASEPVGIHEFLYPLMQGRDSVEIRCDVELGGTDQLFNLHVGRHLQEQDGQPPQILITQPLIDGTDGRKMSKSYGNAIGLTASADEMYGRVMSIADEPMRTWYVHLTDVPLPEIDELLAGHPMEAKHRLAHEITASFHGDDGAASGRRAFEKGIGGELPDEILEHLWPGEGDDLPLPVLLREIGLAASSGEARRVIQQGGVKLDGEPQNDPNHRVPATGPDLLVQVGKRRYARVARRG